MGTARVVSNSTFTPGRAPSSTAIIPAGILITGSHALTDFNQVHVETPTAMMNQTDSNFEVTNGASVSVVGPTQYGNTVVHLTSTGTAITVKNVLDSAPGAQVVKDDVNGINSLGSFVANYSSSAQAGNLQVLKSLTLPNQNATTALLGPSGTFSPPAPPVFRVLTPDDLPSPMRYAYLFDDFFPTLTTAGNIGQLGWNVTLSGSGGTAYISGVANHPGIFQQKTAGMNNSISEIYLNSAVGANPPILRLDNVAWHAIFIWALDSGGTYSPNIDTTIRFGFAVSASGTPPTDGFYFENVSGAGTTPANWKGVARAGGVSTFSGGSTPLDTTFAFHRFEMVNDGSGSNLAFYIDGVLYGSAVTSGLSGAKMIPFVQLSNQEAVNKQGDLDYFSFSMAVTR